MSSALSRGYGTLAGLAFIGAAVFAVPSTLLLDPRPPAEDYLVTVAGLSTGLACMSMPWERLDPRWLHAVGALATIEAAAAVAVFGQPYAAFFFVIAVAVAYMAAGPKDLMVQLILIGAALFAPVFYGPASVNATLQVGLVVFPLLVLSAGVVAYLRQRLVADHRSYRVFAEETLALAQRIGGSPLPPIPRRRPDEVDLPAWSRLRVSAKASGAAACILALPLFTAGLAAAGMKVPEFASDALGGVGIDLPNQNPEVIEMDAIHVGGPKPGEEPRSAGKAPAPDPQAERTGKPPQSPPAEADAGAGAGGTAPAVTQGAEAGTPSGASPPVTDLTGSGGEALGDAVPTGDPEAGHPLHDVLEDTVTGLGGLLDAEKEASSPAP